MDEYYMKYARPLDKLNIQELKSSLYQWRNQLREELEGIVYLKRGLKSDKIEKNLKSKLAEITQKLESFVIQEIENMSEFIFEIEKSVLLEIDDRVYKKYELMRDNFNKILLNIQKLIASSPDLINSREKYEKNKMSYDQMVNSMQTNKFGMKPDNYNVQSNPNEWLDNINSDIDNIKRKPNSKQNTKPTQELNTNTARNKSPFKSKIEKDFGQIDPLQYKSLKSSKDTLRSNSLSGSNSKIKNKAKTIQSRQKSTVSRILNSKTLDKDAVGYEQIKKVNKEIQNVKNMCKGLKSSIEENCVMYSEKQNFNKMKHDFMKLNADMSIIKEDIAELLRVNQDLTKRVCIIEEENYSLRKHNKNLIKFFQSGTQLQVQPQLYEEDTYHNYGNHSGLHQENIRHNVEESHPLSEMSVFNSVNNTSSFEMNRNINQRIDSTNHKGRFFLIPKPSDV